MANPKDPRLVGLIGDPSIAGMDQNGGFTQQDVNAEGMKQKGRLPTSLVELRQGLDNRRASMVHPEDRSGMMGSQAGHAQPQPQKQLTPDQMMAMAKAMLDNTAAQSQGSSLNQRDASGSQVTDASGAKLPDWLVREQEGR